MVSSGLSKSLWAPPQQQGRPSPKYDIEEGTKLFRQMLMKAANEPQTKPSTDQLQPQAVSGGLPPHLLRQREDNDHASQALGNSASANTIEPATSQSQPQPQAVMGGLPPHLLRQRENTSHASQTLGNPASVYATEPATSQSQPQTVIGGLPPHLLRQRENTDHASQALDNSASANAIEPVMSQPQAVTGGLPPHLLRQRENANKPSQATGTPVPAISIDPPASEDDLKTQEVVASQARPAPPPTRPSPLQSPPQSTPRRDPPLNVASKYASPPAPASRRPTKTISLAEANVSMHPVLKKAVGNKFKITVLRDTPPGSPLIPVWDVDPVDQAENRHPATPGIPQKEKWRPKHSEDLESQSLPSSAASVKLSGYDDSDFPDCSRDGKDAASKDVRGNIADNADIAPKGNGGGWVQTQKWKDYASSPRSDGDTDKGGFDSFERGWKDTYCKEWSGIVRKLTYPRVNGVQKQIDEHWQCDVDTKNGFLMSPVEYPETNINPNDPGSEVEWERRLRGTAAMKSTTDFLKTQKRMLRLDKQEREYLARNPPPAHWKRMGSPKPQSSPAPAPAPVSNPVARPIVETVQQSGQGDVPVIQVPVAPVQQPVQDEVNSRMVKVPCHLRPAEPADAPQILEIYNWEVMNGSQALDAKPLVLQDIQRLLTECKSARMPFIVAVQGTPMEATYRKEVPAVPRGPYQQPRQTALYQKITETQPGPDKIFGFGFISCPVAGLAHSVHSNVGRFIGRVHFYVEHASRRNGIGRAILHRLTRCCSKYCVSVDWYEWYDPYRSKVFDEPDYNARNYSRLYIETSSTGEKDPDNGWYQEFLDGMGYLFMSTLDKTRKVKYGPDGQWRDTIVWQHDCRDYKGIPEFDNMSN